MMQQTPEEYELIIQTSLLAILLFVVVFGNSLICLIVWQFKNLRTHANIFVVEMAMADFWNGVVNIPLFICYQLYPSPVLRGRTLAMICLLIRRGCLLQNVLSVSIIFIDRYLVLAYGVRYTAWKTRKIIFVTIVIKWFIGLTVVGSIIYFHSQFEDMGPNVPIAKYIQQYEDNGIMPFPMIILPTFLLLFCIVSYLSSQEIKKTVTFRKGLQGLKMKRFQDLKALKTVRYIIVCYAICILPGVTRSILIAKNIFIVDYWLLFFDIFFLLVTCAINSVIYYARTERFRRALVMFFNNPLEKNKVILELKTYDKVVPRNVKATQKFEQLEFPNLSDDPSQLMFHMTKSSTESKDVISRETDETFNLEEDDPSCYDTKL